MGGVFYGCCGGEEEKPSRKEVTKRGKNVKSSKDSKSKRKHIQEVEEESSEQNSNRKENNMDPKLNMISPNTIKLLTDIGELKNYEHNTLDSSQIEKNLQIHADILARLENPSAFQ